MKTRWQRFKALPPLTKVGAVIGLTLAGLMIICLSPIMLGYWAIACLEDLNDTT